MDMFFFGYSFGVLNTSFDYIAAVLGIEEDALPLYTSLSGSFLPVGATVGALFSGILPSRFGRRTTFYITDLLMILGSALMMISDIRCLLAGRLITGIAVGIISSVVPLYISEVSPAEVRGVNLTIPEIIMSLGINTSYFFGFGIPSSNSAGKFDNLDSQWWRFMTGFPIVIAVIRLCIFVFLLPLETPTFLVSKGREAEAKAALAVIYRPQHIEAELNAIKEANGVSESTYKELFSPLRRKVLVIGLFIAIFQEIGGIDAVASYSHDIIQGRPEDGVSDWDATLFTTIIGGTNFIFTVISAIFVDRQGRKRLLTFGSIVMFLCLILMIVFNLTGLTALPRYCLIGIEVGYSLSWGPVTFLYIGEILNDKGVGLVSLVSWIISMLVVLAVPLVGQTRYGMNGAFAFFAVMMLVATVFVQCFVVETKGLTVDAIQRAFSGKTAATDVEEQPQENSPQKPPERKLTPLGSIETLSQSP
jgi:sugar porter (SP) family MFS transporter